MDCSNMMHLTVYKDFTNPVFQGFYIIFCVILYIVSLKINLASVNKNVDDVNILGIIIYTLEQ